MQDADKNGLDSSASDSHLNLFLNAAKEGSQSGLGRLLEAFRPSLMLMADQNLEQRLRRRMSSSDVVQDTMLTAGKQFESFRGTTSGEFREWLLELFHSRLVDGIRRHQVAEIRRQSLEDEQLSLSDLLSREETPSVAARLNEDATLLLKALEALPTHLQRVIHLRYLENRTFEEIAAETSVSVATVWRQFQEAVEALQKQLKWCDR